MESNNVVLNVDTALVRWWTTINERIRLLKQDGKRPVLIALSRKMPRLIEWFLYNFLPKHPELPSKELFTECELTTELSIPFRATIYKVDAEESYILLDDIIIHGTTLRNVASDLYLISQIDGCGKQCYLSSIFMYNGLVNMPSNVYTEDVDQLIPIGKEDASKVISEMARRIRTANLPLDLEYPILRMDATDSYSAKDVYEHFKSISDCTYLGEWENTATLIFKQDSKVSDFAKMRFFESDRFFSFEIFSPYSLPDYLETAVDYNLFAEGSYRDLWETIIFPVLNYFESHSFLFNEPNGFVLRQNIGRSIIVWANYLLSVSFMIDKCVEIIPTHLRDRLKILGDDVSLILGSRYSEMVICKIRKIVSEKLTSAVNVANEIVGIDCFAPKQFETEYSLFKAHCASHSLSIQDVLARIFRFQHFANVVYDKPQYKFERLFYGETYSSLTKICAPYFGEENINLDINKWIDDQIDNGVIVPKYELYTNQDGYRRWRRFFHAGLNVTE